jgi:hypothetical protein
LLPQQLLEGWRKARIADLQAKNQIWGNLNIKQKC